MLSRRRFLVALSGLSVLVPVSALAARQPSVDASPGLTQAIAAGVSFLTSAQPAGQYNPTLHLLREAPTAAPCKYWLFNDNALAGHFLARLGHQLAGPILNSLATYGRTTNGLHEVLWGVRVGETLDWCPNTHYYETFPADLGIDPGTHVCTDPTSPLICNEVRRGVPMLDWQEYADLAMFGALNQELLGGHGRARTTFTQAMANLFDWQAGGFADKAYTSDPNAGYLTYKLGLALHTGITLGALGTDERRRLAEIILAQQEDKEPSKVGGFYTHYGQVGSRACDVNTETTSTALWGLRTYHESLRVYLPFIQR